MRITPLLVAALAITGCQPSGPAPATATPPEATGSSTTVAATAHTPGGPSLAENEPAFAADPTGDPIPFEVRGRPLPTAVVSSYRDGGGQLLNTEQVLAVLGVRELPFPSAVGVVVTDALVQVDITDASTITRDDGLGWLLVDDRPLGELLDAAAAVAGLDGQGWSSDETETSIAGADCVERTYTNPARSFTWTLSGCTYPEFAGLRALQVRRAGTFETTGIPLTPPAGLVEFPTGFAAPSGALLTGFTVEFTQPDSTGSTTTMTLRYATYGDPTSSLRAALPGWTEVSADEDHGTRFRSANAEWEVTPDQLTLMLNGKFPE